MPFCYLNIGASKNLFAKMTKQTSCATRPAGSAKKGNSRNAAIAKQTRVASMVTKAARA